MKLNKDTYEAYLLDYHDGNLSPSDVENLKQFALEHPELGIDLDEELPIINDGFQPTFDKLHLFKDESFDELEEKIIAKLEGDISTPELELIETKIQKSKSLKRIDQIYEKTKLKPAVLIYEGKNDLLKTIPLWRKKVFQAAVAASLIFAIVWNIPTNPKTPNQPALANVIEPNDSLINHRQTIDLIKKPMAQLVFELNAPKKLQTITEKTVLTETNSPIQIKRKVTSLQFVPSVDIQEFEQLAMQPLETNSNLWDDFDQLRHTWNQLNLNQKVAFSTKKIEEVTNGKVALNLNKKEGWSLAFGDFSISN